MRLDQIEERIKTVELSHLYRDVVAARERLTRLVGAFREKFGTREDAMLLSTPGRSEICGNHTDHNMGSVIAAAIDRDIIAVASARRDGRVCVQSEGRREDVFHVDDATDPGNFPRYKSVGLIAGVVGGFIKRGYKVGGFDAYTSTEVLSGSGLSSSAAFEVMIGNILNHLYNDGKIDNKEIAKIAQYAENEYFGKPCGLMDQMATAVGGFVYIDFASAEPKVEHVDFSLTDAGYELAIVGTGGSHSDLNEDFASIPREMKDVARSLGKEYMREVDAESFYAALPSLRGKVSDRALLRAIHFLSECERVEMMHEALLVGNVDELLRLHRESGHSSFEYLQNVFTTKHREQGLSLALAITEKQLAGIKASLRVHGGGFAGTIQALVPKDKAKKYADAIDSVFGNGACMLLRVRADGAIRII